MFRYRSVGRSPGGWSCGGNYGNRREVAHGEGVRGEGRQKGSKWGVWRRDRVGGVTCLMDAVVGGRDAGGVGDGGCRFGGGGGVGGGPQTRSCGLASARCSWPVSMSIRRKSGFWMNLCMFAVKTMSYRWRSQHSWSKPVTVRPRAFCTAGSETARMRSSVAVSPKRAAFFAIITCSAQL